MRAAVDDLADFTGWDRLVVVVDDARFDIDRGPSRRSQFPQLIVRFQDRCHRGHFGLAIEIVKPHPRQAAGQFLDDGCGHDRCAIVSGCQAAEVAAIEVGMTQKPDPDGGRAKQFGHAVLFYRGKHFGCVDLVMDD